MNRSSTSKIDKALIPCQRKGFRQRDNRLSEKDFPGKGTCSHLHKHLHKHTNVVDPNLK